MFDLGLNFTQRWRRVSTQTREAILLELDALIDLLSDDATLSEWQDARATPQERDQRLLTQIADLADQLYDDSTRRALELALSLQPADA